MDNLLEGLQTTSITENNTFKDHPRWSDYKNVGKLSESQKLRRQSHLKRQKAAQEKCLNRIRDLCDEADVEEYENLEDMGQSFGHRLPYDSPMSASGGEVVQKWHAEYMGMLMLGEWLIDVPEDFGEKWMMVPCPDGRRCLVVAKKGTTRAYAKNGRILTAFTSALPGGSYSIRGSVTVLDCIYMRGPGGTAKDRGDRFYVLDVLCWNRFPYVDANFEVRQFVVRSKLDELVEDRLPFPFFAEPPCPCTKNEMTKMMARDFPFKLDGCLFYYKDGAYTPNESPLVGWLKPWMMTELLGVPIPEIYQKQKPLYVEMESDKCHAPPADDSRLVRPSFVADPREDPPRGVKK